MSGKNRTILFFLCCSVLGNSVAVPVADVMNGEEVKSDSNKSSVALKEQLVKFHPISQKQYNSILKLSGGQPIISEARLINSGIRHFGDLRSISSAIESGVQYVLNVTGLNTLNEKETQAKVEGYPLCVIKVSDWQSSQNHDNNNNGEHPHKMERGNENTNEYFYNNREEGNSRDQPAVNCVVVVKRNEDEDDAGIMRNSWLNDLRYASTINPYDRNGYYPSFLNPPFPSQSLSPYYYNYMYNQYSGAQKSAENIYKQKLTKTASTENEGKSVNDSNDYYYRQLMFALNNYYLQQSYKDYQQVPITQNYQGYQPNTYRQYVPFGMDALPSSIQRYPSSHHHKIRQHDSSEEENDYSNEQFSQYE